MQSFLHFEKSQVHASRCAVLALVVGSLGMGLSFEMDGARVGILQWNYVKLGSLSSSCLTEFACFCLRR